MHYDIISRCLGHTDMSRTSAEAYMGPLANAVFDNSKVVFGEGGGMTVDERIARLPEYCKFKVGSGPRELAQGEVSRPKLPPATVRVVDAHPDVVTAKKSRDEATARLRRLEAWDWLEGRERVVAGKTPGLAVVVDVAVVGGTEGEDPVDVALAAQRVAAANLTNTRMNAVQRERTASVNRFKLRNTGPSVLTFCPDLLVKASNLLEQYFEERVLDRSMGGGGGSDEETVRGEVTEMEAEKASRVQSRWVFGKDPLLLVLLI